MRKNAAYGRQWAASPAVQTDTYVFDRDLLTGLPVYGKGLLLTTCILRYYGPEFIVRKLRKWLKDVGDKTLYIEPGSPWENGYCESFNGKMRYLLLDGEIFYTLFEAKVIIERWRRHYNEVRPHSSLGGRPPKAPETWEVNDSLLVIH